MADTSAFRQLAAHIDVSVVVMSRPLQYISSWCKGAARHAAGLLAAVVGLGGCVGGCRRLAARGRLRGPGAVARLHTYS